ncbi:hypothetical protein NBRGN_060_00230 [Nocardia brasiliensis NBRC 14402]|nr:hypothetical protein NBRGN_060_00230 [Nocardia brasiliensis NBRC 14402]
MDGCDLCPPPVSEQAGTGEVSELIAAAGPRGGIERVADVEQAGAAVGRAGAAVAEPVESVARLVRARRIAAIAEQVGVVAARFLRFRPGCARTGRPIIGIAFLRGAVGG